MYNDKYTKELAKRGDVSLVMYVSGERIEYVVCRYYDSTKPVGNQWYSGSYFEDILDATETFRFKTGQIHRDRLLELATLFKDELVDELGYTMEDFRFEFDVDEDELKCLGFESEDEEDE